MFLKINVYSNARWSWMWIPIASKFLKETIQIIIFYEQFAVENSFLLYYYRFSFDLFLLKFEHNFSKYIISFLDFLWFQFNLSICLLEEYLINIKSFIIIIQFCFEFETNNKLNLLDFAVWINFHWIKLCRILFTFQNISEKSCYF